MRPPVSDQPTGREAAALTVRLRDGWRYCLAVFAASWFAWGLLSVLVTGAIVAGPPPISVPGWPAHELSQGWHNLFTGGERQDALWYLRIATQGYAPGDGSAAFFPVYPLAVRAVALVPGIGPLAAATVVAQGCYYGALVVFYALGRLEFSTSVARRAVLLLACFPTAFFFLVPYTEGPFLLLGALAFWFARRDRWLYAATAAALAAGTRSVGALLALGLAAEAVQQWREHRHRLWPRLAAAAATGLGPLAYVGFWWVRYDDPAAPLNAQANWERVPTAPWSTVVHAVEHAYHQWSYWLIDLLVVGVVAVAVVAGIRMLRRGYLVYGLASLLLPLCYPFPARPLMSVPRFVVVIFPAFWVISRALERRRALEPVVVGLFAAGYTLLATLSLNWYQIF